MRHVFETTVYFHGTWIRPRMTDTRRTPDFLCGGGVTMAEQQQRARQIFTAEFKREAVRACAMLLLFSPGGCTGSRREDASTGRTMVIAVGADEASLALNRDRLGRYPLNAGLCEPLVRLTREFAVAPALATRWEMREPNTVRFNLASGVTFSDGAHFDARSVAFTLALSTRARIDYTFLGDSSVRVVDDTTLDVRPARTNRRLVNQLVHPTYGILATGSDPARRPVCTGPFRLLDYTPHEHLTVVRNERYRGPRARVDTLVFRFIPDETTRALALRSHQVDLIIDVGGASARVLRTLPDLRVVAAPPGAVLMMYMNVNGTGPHAALRDSALRRAVAMAIDRRTLVERVLGADGAAVVSTVNPPVVLGAHAALVRGVPFDTVAAARSLGPRRRSLSLIFNPNSVDNPTVEFVQAQLFRVGIDVKVERLDAAAFESRLNSGDFDLDLEMPSQNDANPAFLLALRWYSKSGTRSAKFTHGSAGFDALVERALGATTDDDARRAAAEAMHQLVDVEVGAIPLAGISRVYAMRDRVQGFVPHPSRLNQDWSEVWLRR